VNGSESAFMPRSKTRMAGDSTVGSVRSVVAIAGPSSSLTIPGIVVSQIVRVMARTNSVIRINVDDRSDFDSELFRAPSLAAALHDDVELNVVTFEAPRRSWARNEAFEWWMSSHVETAVAFVWPGIDSTWVRQFVAAAKKVGATSTVVCASAPRANSLSFAHIADFIKDADQVLVGRESDAQALRKELGSRAPSITTHQALQFSRSVPQPAVHRIMAFLPKDNMVALATLLAAFDAIPEAWVDSYHLEVLMRFTGEDAPQLVAASYHSECVKLNGDDISSEKLGRLVAGSSALIIADPVVDSRAFSTAVDCGLPVVVVASANLPGVGSGYVGALLADLDRPVSVYVAVTHALRLSDLQFPRPEEWQALVNVIGG